MEFFLGFLYADACVVTSINEDDGNTAVGGNNADPVVWDGNDVSSDFNIEEASEDDDAESVAANEEDASAEDADTDIADEVGTLDTPVTVDDEDVDADAIDADATEVVDDETEGCAPLCSLNIR